MNLNGRTALDPRWTRHHTPSVESFMLADIVVVRKDPHPTTTVSYNQETQQYTVNSFGTDFDNEFGFPTDIIWSGKARIQPFGIIGDMVVGQDTTSRRLMRVQIADMETGINVDDMIKIVSSPEDPELELFRLEVRGTIGSSNAWVTDLVCEADTKHG